MNTEDGNLFVIGLNHRTTPLELREQFSLPPDRAMLLADRLRTQLGLTEAVVLSTCNRLEIYGVGRPSAHRPREIFEVLAGITHAGRTLPAFEAVESLFCFHRGAGCVQHLFRVASSLDSLVVGETEIVGQVKKAYQQAQQAGTTGKTLNRVFQKALGVSKQVRTRSGIGRCSTSVGSVSLDLAEKIFGEDLSRQTILIIGAGKIGETTLRHLAKRGVQSILVANRSLERAQELAAQFQGRALPFSELAAGVAQADIVISSTSAPHCVLSKSDLVPLMSERRNRPLFLIDLAVPRDIDPGVLDVEGAYLYNIDQLADIARQNAHMRQAEAVAAEEMVAAEAQLFAARLTAAPPLGGKGRALADVLTEELSFGAIPDGSAA